ncbi:hypothetical protein PENDEC_c001G02414 [Penicillium decumbens]|uniref:PBSP domain protein n=1 Tax=Penicillium decumbens TaxID=69771 RepID=A0A1V6PP02_PENDC|nr:hypothetical protein PENDEC_c001G02414 [Penicillium decumbens]
MATTLSPASQSAIPRINAQTASQCSSSSTETQDQGTVNSTKAKIPQSKLRLHIETLRHPATASFLTFIPDIASTLDAALHNIVRYLYSSPNHVSSENPSNHKTQRPSFSPLTPPTRSVTLHLRDIDGVAYTTGTELDDDHKEIHLSLAYVEHCANGDDPLHELVGVLTHELVHCYQHTSPKRVNDEDAEVPHPPGGLIEGIADFVRLKAGLEPPHWKRPQSAEERAEEWDAGYQHTAYFLAWIEDVRVGRGAIGMLNDRLLRVGYVGEQAGDSGVGFWKGLFGASVAELWDEYGEYLDGTKGEKARGNWEDEILNAE